MSREIYVIFWSSPRFRGEAIPAGSGEANCVQYIMGGHVGEGVRDVVIEHIDAYCSEPDEGWSRVVTEDVARAVARQAEVDGEISRDLYEFVEKHAPGCERGLNIADRTFAAA